MKEHALIGVIAVLRAVNANALMEAYRCFCIWGTTWRVAESS